MTTFVDPRTNPPPPAARFRQPAAREEDVAELVQFCKAGRVYDVERWIQAGRPLQASQNMSGKPRRRQSALEVALDRKNHALVLLLLCNGYDPNLEANSPLDLALRSRRWDLVDLLLEWGADPHRVSLDDLFETYDSKLFERFRALGVDLSADHEFAAALAYHTSNKPLFGFAKRHREQDPKIQTELNIALGHHASEGNAKGVQLCLWAGADPHAPAMSLRYPALIDEDDADDGESDRFLGFSAVYAACSHGDVDIVKRLVPDPSLDDFDDLYSAAHSGAVMEFLARSALPNNVRAVIEHQLWRLTFGFRDWESVDTLRRLFGVGVRWQKASKEEAASIRRAVLKLDNYNFVDVIKLFAEADHCSSDVVRELGRTPSIRNRMKKVGFIPSEDDDSSNVSQTRPTRSREVLSKFGNELPKPTPKLPRTVHIGTWDTDGREIRLDRAALFELIWSKPVMKLAAEWGLSDRGLGKACRRLKIPVPPRGYWARVDAGQRRRRPQLPKLNPGEAEEIVIWCRDDHRALEAN